MSLENILLGLLRSPKSGYELKDEFDAGVANFWPAELSQIYVTLKRLTKRGWLANRVEPSGKGPDRRVYRRTADGRRALRAWLAGEPQIGDERGPNRVRAARGAHAATPSADSNTSYT